MPAHDSTGDLFASSQPAPRITPSGKVPLAERLRPRSFDDLVGQDDVVGPGRPLRSAIEQDRLSSVIFWGPPGCGKTTLAGLVAQYTKSQFVPFSAVTGGIPELREIIKAAEQRRTRGMATILFVDEIHRFNKAQQDAFLPHVERGTVVLIGATTENPSFELIAPLLSRSLVIVLQPLTTEALGSILDRAVADTDRGLGSLRLTIQPAARDRLIAFGNGDARSLLTTLEFVAGQAPVGMDGRRIIDESVLEAALLKKALRYDKGGEEHYNLISAYIKSLRDSDPDGALYWLARMLEGGENPRFIARRMVIFASEDIGNAEPQALVVANAVAQAVEFVGLPEAQITLAHGTTYLASRPKDNASYVGLQEAIRDARQHGNLGVPLHLRNAVTSLMKEIGYGQGYRYVHNDPAAKSEQGHLPEPLKGKRYYRPRTAQDHEERG
ncbi:MAG TPA: replication-associated recombination protein A [Nitrospira sp.]|nr:replication-associated recombination protein A [Nitrospira sp.]MCW5794360.1 replication-associated recombination protein A [Nitrospira sp.]HMU31532.1 replication-associated recombination protein A [Nitrospira sp.]HMV56290.1 replication-associated recombination protein A [Nitrospira sp.]HMW86440.1 replication-associated recombination protein A [Nitrospira sp.]